MATPVPTLRDIWNPGRETLGGWCAIPSAFSVELMASAGFDWVCVDMQHGLIGEEHMAAMLQALSISRTPAFVRVAWNRPEAIMRALDAGADGIVVPMVNSPEEALAASRACRYAPEGTRSWGPTRPALLRPGFDPESANREVVCVVMVETVDALARLEEILSVPGIDGVLVGPNDLALSDKRAGEPARSEPEYEAELAALAAACLEREIVPGIALYREIESFAERWRSAGFRMFSVSSDSLLLVQAATAELERLRASRPPEPSRRGGEHVRGISA
jgi:4-hydroxy-2-oxoheptanedioate aldolase